MGRSPCCENSGLNKGPWSSEEDGILTNFINQNGHGNWRALPKRAGLMRCGKSCRLRWMNYLRPDIKRGNFTPDEEDTIVKLHQHLGNKWSIIAARLPGRTDNEIKNIWHTHLKKRLNVKPQPKSETKIQELESFSNFVRKEERSPEPTSSAQSSVSTAVDGGSDDFNAYVTSEAPFGNLMEMDESFWSEVFSVEHWSGTSGFPAGDSESRLQSFNSSASDLDMEVGYDFWQNVFCEPQLFQL